MALNIYNDRVFLYETPTDETVLIELNASGITCIAPEHLLLREAFDTLVEELDEFKINKDYSLGEAYDFSRENIAVLFTQPHCPKTFGHFDVKLYENHCIAAIKEALGLMPTDTLAIHAKSPMLQRTKVYNYIKHLSKTFTVNIYGG